MMARKTVALVLAGGMMGGALLMISGCGKGGESTSQPATTAPTTAAAAPSAAPAGEEKPYATTATAPSTSVAGAATEGGGVLASEMSARAQNLMDQVKTAINDKDWDRAQELVDNLKGMKDQLSPTLQAQVDGVEKDLQQARSTAQEK